MYSFRTHTPLPMFFAGIMYCHMFMFSLVFYLNFVESVNGELLISKSEDIYLQPWLKNIMSILDFEYNGTHSPMILGIGIKDWTILDIIEEIAQFSNCLEIPSRLLYLTRNTLTFNVNTKHETPRFLLLIIENEVSLNIWQRIHQYVKMDGRTSIVILFVSQSSDTCKFEDKQKYLNVFHYLWNEFGLLNVIILYKLLRCTNPQVSGIVAYDIFTSKMDHFSDLSDIQRFIHKKTNQIINFNRNPLRLSVFDRTPTSRLSEKINNTLCYDKIEGMDGDVLHIISQYMNFTPNICEPDDHLEFGYLSKNGSFTGSLGDVIYKKASISFNSRFIKLYDSKDIEFTFPISSDNLCIVVPKASRIPKWLTITLTFTFSVKVLVMIIFISSYLIFVILKKIYDKFIGCSREEYLMDIFFDMLRIFITSPIFHMPDIVSQRVFIASCLLFSLVLVSAFQGQIVNVISSPLYYKDINTLQELEESGLTIGIGSENLKDTFPSFGDPIVEKLHKRTVLIKAGNLMEAVAHKTLNIASVVRKSNAEVDMTKYMKALDTKTVHIMKECPQYYFLSYITRKGSVILPRMNDILSKAVQSGLIEKLANYTGSQKEFKNNNPRNLKVFSVSDLQLAFYILIIGVLCACVSFGFEIKIKRGARNM